MESGQDKSNDISKADIAKPTAEHNDIGRLNVGPTRLKRVGLLVRSSGPNVELEGYWTMEDLLGRLGQNSFAFEEVIVRCLLFIAALHPLDEQNPASQTREEKNSLLEKQRRKLIGVARMLCALIHYHASKGSSQKLLAQQGLKITREQLDDLDQKFFLPIGGSQSLLFAPNIQDEYIG